MSQIPINISHELAAPAPAAPVAAVPEVVAPPAPVEPRVYFTPPIDIYDAAEGLVLIADLPGVATEMLELEVQNNKLTLLGRVPAAVPAGARLIHKEYDEGDFVRSFILSDEVDHERIRARLTGGVLEVVLPRAAKAAPRKIQVNGE